FSRDWSSDVCSSDLACHWRTHTLFIGQVALMDFDAKRHQIVRFFRRSCNRDDLMPHLDQLLGEPPADESGCSSDKISHKHFLDRRLMRKLVLNQRIFGNNRENTSPHIKEESILKSSTQRRNTGQYAHHGDKPRLKSTVSHA